MENSSRKVVEKMFEAFASGNIEKILETVSEDTHWVYHGTQVIPPGVFQGKEGVGKFFSRILKRTEVIKFEAQQYIVDGNMVVVLGNEHQRVKSSGKELRQKWVQIYTVKNDLIVRMEEFATSEATNQ